MTTSIQNDKITVYIDKKEKVINKNSFASTYAPKDALVCSINGFIRDLSHVLSDKDNIQFLSYKDEQGKSTFYHSSAHVLGYSILKFDPTIKLVAGPPTANGFYYDCFSEKPLKEEDLKTIEQIARDFINENHKYERLEMSHSDVYDKMYKDNKFKRYFIRRSIYKEKGVDFDSDDKILDEETIDKNILGNMQHIVYKLSTFYDYCTGPHIPSTKYIKCFDILNTGASYFLSDASRESLTRIYAISFPSKSEQESYYKIMKLRKERHHKLIGEKYDLLYFSELSPGSAFFLPDGAFIYNKLIEYIRLLYRSYGFDEVITPNIFNTSLWEISGHLQNYKADMFLLSVEKQDWALKPMNCPGHCLIFKSKARSKRNLPMRFADFGVLHRNELSGALSGLTRVRRFQQDDAHIFCALDQVEGEIIRQLDFVKEVYSMFEFKYEFFLSTRPKEKYLGTVEQWDRAESMIATALEKSGSNYEINPGDGAFYGPKIDIVLTDALERKHQCATIQLDFQLPERFDLSYVDAIIGETDNQSDNPLQVSKDSDAIKKMKPVMIHRAILGSLERFIGILIEHYGMDLPFWVNPRQISLIPVTSNDEKIMDYCKMVKSALLSYQVKLFDSDDTLNKRIRNAETEKYVLNLIIGENEVKNGTVSIRKNRKDMKLSDLEDLLSKCVAKRVKNIYTMME
ncbi:Threonyl-tRNA synthetase [Pseudoloma neurophilia]|uniref:Probable threonine--tRNA ligase, cytoplasmic n=1 Tax=Pseudoloma neurophilia TaxID=146866 RepID=A0A0R0M215_9MICR|nr:Threonyl-tRNA synthetase [Pseudoloma neurophilia]